jgi:endoglycosylceramidase
LTFTPNPAVTAPTEIYLPESGFPGGVDVAGADIVNWNPQSRLLTVETADDAGPVTVTVTPAS